VDWPHVAMLLAGLLLIGVATWLVYRLGRSVQDPRVDGERGQEAQAQGEPEDDVDGVG
jgi:hypothetical protein